MSGICPVHIQQFATNNFKQAEAELCQAQVKLVEVKVEVVVKVGE